MSGFNALQTGLCLFGAGPGGAGGQAYSAKVLATQSANLLAYWPLWETSGAVADNLEGTSARDGAYTGVTLNNSTFSNGDPVPLWDGANDYCNIFTASLGTAFNGTTSAGAEGSLSGWFKAYEAAVWGTTIRYLVRLYSAFPNEIVIYHNNSSNNITFKYRAAETDELVSDTSLAGSLNWFHLAMTWSDAADEMKAFINGSQVGTTQTGLATWSATGLNATQTVIGAVNTTPGSVWYGWAGHVALWNTPLTPAQVAALAVVA